ncbi:MAG: ABC transporter permease [Oceanospirillaceae bacterium]|jgi:putative ABC transport system permease protein|nr:ABC transporter permease [Oceanospirillaceae bacterium]MBT5629258.1 ABC transporter permease [Oceanospirillaceae bacterium]MBT6100694.1 ABC transporter permease [Oceanospirillaceae bacterium]MBT7673065.1 ABC transporter permease [Oceanospirillaceae bacterium]MDC1352366.1 ABC transporter permease [Oceanospirillaceae bacterium]|tara:strand:- start:1051 stop:2301 length:1251 start_codon:yes stop_codon:yes gene_type:complete
MNLRLLAQKSLASRRSTAILTIVSIAVSVILLLGVEKVRVNAKSSFANTISGTDLIVGARSGSIQLLLYSVFRIGSATNNISWKSYQHIAQQKGVKWTIPISLGDSHRGFRVMGTSRDYFSVYQYGEKRTLKFTSGKQFEAVFDAVIGSEVAKTLNYSIGDQVIISHGTGSASFTQHKDKPFVISGILEHTGTPVDRTVHVSLAGIEAMHVNWNGAVKKRKTSKVVTESNLQPESITAFLVGLDSKIVSFKMQRYINDYAGEPLLAIFPGIALHELWSLMSVAEKALLIISLFVVVAALTGMLAVSLAGLNERRREVAILRSVGASHWHIMGLLITETVLLTMIGIIIGLIMLYSSIWVAQPLIEKNYGLFIPITAPNVRELGMISVLLAASFLVGLVPAYFAYKNSLADGMSVRS